MNEELELEQNMSDPVDDIVEDSDLEQGTNSTQPVLQEALGIDPEMAANAMKDQGFLPDNPVELAKEAGNLATKFLKRPHDLEYEKTFIPFMIN